MSDATTKKMIDRYVQKRPPSMFLTSLFRTPAQNYHVSETVEIDIQRFDEDIAIPVIDGNGHRVMTLDLATNKEFKPPILKESMPIRAGDLYQRYPGDNPFAEVGFMAKAGRRAMDGLMHLEEKIRRNIELQASQVLQEGTVSLINEDGAVVYTLDYGMKATHKIDSAVDWSAATSAQILADIETACSVNRDDGKVDSDTMIMGVDAYKDFIGNSGIQALFDNRRINVGDIGPMRITGMGGQFRGTIDVGNYKLDVWTYNGKYKNPNTGTLTTFIDDANVVVTAADARRDLTFGAVPMFPTPTRVLQGVIPRRIAGRGVDIFTNAWTDTSGETLTVGASSRPLCIPTALDAFARIDTNP